MDALSPYMSRQEWRENEKQMSRASLVSPTCLLSLFGGTVERFSEQKKKQEAAQRGFSVRAVWLEQKQPGCGSMGSVCTVADDSSLLSSLPHTHTFLCDSQ